jgi:hypothetical protein
MLAGIFIGAGIIIFLLYIWLIWGEAKYNTDKFH